MEVYTLSIIGVLALCLLSVLLAIYSGSSKGRAGALSGPVLPTDDNNLLYRIDRAHMNSVEALAPFVVPVLLAMLCRSQFRRGVAPLFAAPRSPPSGASRHLPAFAGRREYRAVAHRYRVSQLIQRSRMAARWTAIHS
jgi:hypothetical protein